MFLQFLVDGVLGVEVELMCASGEIAKEARCERSLLC
jgi:hypothetical protein